MYDEPDDLDELQPSPQAKGSVKVNASLIEYDAEKMFDAIVRTAAHKIVEQARGDIREAVTDEAERVRADIEYQKHRERWREDRALALQWRYGDGQ